MILTFKPSPGSKHFILFDSNLLKNYTKSTLLVSIFHWFEDYYNEEVEFRIFILSLLFRMYCTVHCA